MSLADIGASHRVCELSSSARRDCRATSHIEGRKKAEDWGDTGVSTQPTTADPAAPVPASSRRRRPPRTLYRGDPGMWAWVLHRISGATIFFFLFVHVLDAAMLRVSPQTYNAVI